MQKIGKPFSRFAAMVPQTTTRMTLWGFLLTVMPPVLLFREWTCVSGRVHAQERCGSLGVSTTSPTKFGHTGELLSSKGNCHSWWQRRRVTGAKRDTRHTSRQHMTGIQYMHYSHDMQTWTRRHQSDITSWTCDPYHRGAFPLAP